MKTTLLFYIFSLFSGNLFSQQISFKPALFNEFRISDLKYTYTEDFNSDGVMDYYGYLYNSFQYNLKLGYDSSIINGYHKVLRNKDGTIRKKYRIEREIIPSGIFDINKDGRKDLLFGTKDSISILYRIDTFNHIEKLIHHCKKCLTFENNVVDMNNDGLLDIVSKRVTDSNFYYILYQMPGDTFIPVYFKNYCTPYMSDPVFTSRLHVGDFNHDGKKDLVSYSNYFYSKIYIYLQQDSGKFNVVSRQLPGSAISLAVLDNNHDGWDDILVELGDNPDMANQKLVLIPQMNTGITNQQYIYNYSDNMSGGSSSDERLYVDDMNCDGYPEVYRFRGDCEWKVYVHDTKIDTTYSNQTPINFSQTPETYNYSSLIMGLPGVFDWDGDGKNDFITIGKAKPTNIDYEFIYFKNNSVDDNTTLQYLSYKIDTVLSLTKKIVMKT